MSAPGISHCHANEAQHRNTLKTFASPGTWLELAAREAQAAPERPKREVSRTFRGATDGGDETGGGPQPARRWTVRR